MSMPMLAGVGLLVVCCSSASAAAMMMGGGEETPPIIIAAELDEQHTIIRPTPANIGTADILFLLY